MIRLNVGMPPSGVGVWLGCLLPSVVVLNLVLLVPVRVLAGSEISPLAWLMVLPVLLLDALLVWRFAHDYGQAFWLDGRVLIRRTVTGRRHYDLSVAHVGAESAQPQWAGPATQLLPRLIVQVPGHPPARMWLRDPSRRSALLPPYQLAALAHAIDPTFQHPVAHRLQTLASDPFGGALS